MAFYTKKRLSTVNKAATNICVRILREPLFSDLLDVNLSTDLLGRVVAAWLLEKLPQVSTMAAPFLCSHQQGVKGLVPTHPCQRLQSSILFILAVLEGVKRAPLAVALIIVSPVTHTLPSPYGTGQYFQGHVTTSGDRDTLACPRS